MTDQPQTQPVEITIGDQIFRIRAAPAEVDRYHRAEKLVNELLDGLVRGGAIGGPRLLAMVAFQVGVNLELLRDDVAGGTNDHQEALQRIEALIERIDAATEALR